MDHATALALLEWQMELGADEAIGDAPINRYELAAKVPPVKAAPVPGATESDAPALSVDPVGVAKAAMRVTSPLFCRGARRKTGIPSPMRLP